MKILVSACLLGCPVRYDGRHKYCPEIAELGQAHELLPVCPETECGMPTPRPSMTLLDGRLVTNSDGQDLTEMLAPWITGYLKKLKTSPPPLAILKSRSPSCGRNGMFRLALERHFPDCRVLDENELSELSLE
jgi:uncharacterized protein YbbK (DUF523 family)